MTATAKILNFVPQAELAQAVLLLEPDEAVARRIEGLLIVRGYPVFRVETLKEVETLLSRRPVAAVIASLAMGPCVAENLMQRIRVGHPSLPVMFLHTDEPVREVSRVMRLGAAQVISVTGNTRLSAELEAGLEEAVQIDRSSLEPVGLAETLTPPQRELVQLYAHGLDAADVRAEMGLPANMERQLRQSVLVSLRARNICEAIRIAYSC